MDRNRKRELRDLNRRAWAGDKDVFSVGGSLDSSLKKNTAFIKRLRTAITASSLNTFLTEIRTLSLHKYLSEIISAVFEGLCKLKSPGEIAAGVEIASALHQRFGPAEFTRQIGWLLGRGLSTPDKSQLKNLAEDARDREVKERLARHRVLLRVATELWLVEVLRSLDDIEKPDDAGTKKENVGASIGKGPEISARSKAGPSTAKADGDADAEPFPLEVLKDMLGHDREHANLPLVVLFVKSFGWDILGVKLAGEEGRKSVEADGATSLGGKDGEDAGSEGDDATNGLHADDPPLTSDNLQTRFKNILTRYLDDVKAHVVRDQRSLAAQSRRNAEAYVKSGEIFEDRQANFEKQTKTQERLVANAQVLCDALGVDMPDLVEKEAADAAASVGIGLVKTGEYLRGQGEGAGIWEDEDERRFYENLMDLKGRVPAVLLEDGKKKKSESDETGKKATETPESQEKPESNGTVTDAAAVDTDDASTAIVNKSVGAQVDALLVRLPELQTKDMVDQLALDFCFLNSKASRNRLLKALQEVPKGRSDLYPMYGRLIATLGQYLSDIPQGMTTYLDDEFRSLQRRKQKEFLGQVRLSNIRYLAELTKFGVVPEHVIFHCFKVSLDDFSRMNIEIISNLLENCGRYLFRNPETAPRMSSFLETLQRKKTAQHLGQQERMLLENSVYYVDPPERAAIQQKERTPVDLFVRKLVYLDMNRRNYAKVLKSIRKLHWEEKEVVQVLRKIFSKPGKVKFSNVHFLAVLASALYRHHQDFVIDIVDGLLEQITLGLEQNDFKFNQRRISEVKYLGELYNYKMVDSTVIFDTLYRIVGFGHEGGTPSPDKLCPLDLPDDYFRIRLICTILDTCGLCFDRGTAKKKLDFFLTFFQYYVFTKDPMPMDVDFLIQDTYATVRPQWKVASDLSEAASLFADAVAKNYKNQEIEKAAEAEEDAEDALSEDGMPEDAIPDGEDGQEAEDGQSSEEVETPPNETAPTRDSESEEEQIVVTRKEEELDPEFEADFDKAFKEMMNESMESRKFERKPVFDVPLPMRRTNRETRMTGDESPVDGATTPTNTMAFSLMTKKGNRAQTRTIDLPSDSHFAVAMKSQKQAEREEQQRIKDLVLNYDLNDEHNEGEFPPLTPISSVSSLSVSSHQAPLVPNLNRAKAYRSQGLENRLHYQPRQDKGANHRGAQRARKLQMSDVDWYGLSTTTTTGDRGRNARPGKSNTRG